MRREEKRKLRVTPASAATPITLPLERRKSGRFAWMVSLYEDRLSGVHGASDLLGAAETHHYRLS